MPVEKVNFFDTIYPASRGSAFLAPLAAHIPGEAMKLSRNTLKNLSKRYKAILKKCCLLNGLGMLLVAGSCLFITPNETMAIDYTIDKDCGGHDFTLENYSTKARVIHDGDTLTILNDATVSFDFEKIFIEGSGGSIALTTVGSIIYGYGDEKGIYITGGSITSIADPLILCDPSYGIYITKQGPYNPAVHIKDTNIDLKKFDIGIYIRQGHLTIINNTRIRTRNNRLHIAIYAKDDSTIDIKTDNLTLDSGYIIYSRKNAKVNILSQKSSSLAGNIDAGGDSHVNCRFLGKTVWTGSSNKYNNAIYIS